MSGGNIPETSGAGSSSRSLRRKVTKRHDFGESHDINITPAIDLLVSLIPFLLISAVFMPIASIETFAPSRNAAAAKSQTSLVMVIISSRGLTVTASGPIAKDTKGPVEISKTGGAYDYATLTLRLMDMKKLDPSSEDLLIMAEPNIEYSKIIDVMDAARSGTDGTSLFPQAFFGGATT